MEPYHIHPAHLDNYLQSRQGQFSLEALPDGRTPLIGTTWYSNRMWPASYWSLWSDYIIHRIHGRVLTHIKTLADGPKRALPRERMGEASIRNSTMKRIMAKFGACCQFSFWPSWPRESTVKNPPRTRKRCRTTAAKVDPVVIAKLIQQLGSRDFKTREAASRELVKLDEAPDALRQAAKSADAEVARRDEIAIGVITARIEEKEFQAMIGDLDKIGLDRFVRRMVTDEKFAGDKQWETIQTIAKAVTIQANKLGQRKFNMADFDVKTMKRLLLRGDAKHPVSVERSVIRFAKQRGTSPVCRSPL